MIKHVPSFSTRLMYYRCCHLQYNIQVKRWYRTYMHGHIRLHFRSVYTTNIVFHLPRLTLVPRVLSSFPKELEDLLVFIYFVILEGSS
jgi:hypothetical protein